MKKTLYVMLRTDVIDTKALGGDESNIPEDHVECPYCLVTDLEPLDGDIILGKVVALVEDGSGTLVEILEAKNEMARCAIFCYFNDGEPTTFDLLESLQ